MNLVTELILKFLVYFGLITIPKRELRVGDVFVSVSGGLTREIVSLNPTGYVLSSPDNCILSGGLSSNYLFDEEIHYYLGNIND